MNTTSFVEHQQVPQLPPCVWRIILKYRYYLMLQDKKNHYCTRCPQWCSGYLAVYDKCHLLNVQSQCFLKLGIFGHSLRVLACFCGSCADSNDESDESYPLPQLCEKCSSNELYLDGDHGRYEEAVFHFAGQDTYMDESKKQPALNEIYQMMSGASISFMNVEFDNYYSGVFEGDLDDDLGYVGV